MTANPDGPPGIWRWILRRAIPARDRATLLAELDEMYARRVDRLGRAGARRWYREEVMAFLVRVPDRGIRGLQTSIGGRVLDGSRQVGQILRGLGRAPGFVTVATLTLALGIGGNALIFAIADRAFLRPLPYPDPDRLVAVLEGWSSSLGSVEILQRELATVESLGAARDGVGATFEPEGEAAIRVSVAHVSPEYLLALGIVPSTGRLFRPEESEPGRGGVALLSAPFAHRLGGAGQAVGRSIQLDGNGYQVVGVLPDGFDLPSHRNDIWIPAVMDHSPANVGFHWGMGVYTMVARMRPGMTPEQVMADVLRVQEAVRRANPLWTPPPDFWNEGRVTLLKEARGRRARTPLLLLLGAVGLVLLVVCANVANLVLSRGLTRRRDQAVRAALGAGGGRLAAVQLAEVMFLALAGSVLGLALAAGGLELLRPLLPGELPGVGQLRLDLRVIFFTLGVALSAGLLSGILPALRMAGQAPGDLLREEDRGRTGGGKRRRTTRILVAGQMAVAVVLVTGAGLLARSLAHLGKVDPGFASADRVTARVDLPPGLPSEREARAIYLREIQGALAAAPELAGVALASSIPFGNEREGLAVFIPGVTDDPNNLPVVRQRRVSENYFEVLAIPLLAGRGFRREDGVESQAVAMVDRGFAERFFPGEEAVGRAIRYPWRGATDILVVGVAENTHDEALSSAPEPTVYFPVAQMGSRPLGYARIVARATGDLQGALGAIQLRSRGLDDRMAVSGLSPYPELLRGSMATPRLLTVLLVLFSATTLALGCIGVYGAASFSVKERFREIGVRITLGADPTDIRNRVVREGLWLALPGGVLGLLLAAAGGRFLQGFLFGVSALDPVTFLAVPAILAGAAILAVFLPARRATRVDPATVLREE